MKAIRELLAKPEWENRDWTRAYEVLADWVGPDAARTLPFRVYREALSRVLFKAGSLDAGLRAADGVMWMAERYAEAGGSGGIEMENYTEAKAAVDAALASAGG